MQNVVNKVVVGSGHGDVPTYVGEGVASCSPPGMLSEACHQVGRCNVIR